jgi:hypothetical protein
MICGGRLFSRGIPVSSTNKIERHDPIMRVTYNVEGYGDSFDAPDSILGLFLYVLCGPSFCYFIEILFTDQLVYLYNLGIF